MKPTQPHKAFRHQHSFREWRESFCFVLPLLAFVLAFVLIPVFGTLADSLFMDVAFVKKRFIGFENYRWLLQDPGFWQSFRFTLLFVFVSVPLEMVLGLLFALLLNEPSPVRGLLRACVLLPWAIPAAISARVWELVYNYGYGLANTLWLNLSFSTEPVNWLGSAAGAFFALVLADTWKTTPFVAIILLAGLSAIPGDLYRQAMVDGAGLGRRFVRITLPLLRPTLIVALIFRTIDALRIFDMAYVLTHGGPGGSTMTLSLYGYKYFLLSDFGYGSAVSVVLFLMALLLSLAYTRLGRFGEELR